MKDKKALDDKVHELHGVERAIQQDTELGAVMKNLDSTQELNKNTRLTEEQISAIISLESLQDLGILDKSEITIGQKFKELNISKNGEGRKEKVDIIRSERETQASGGFGERFKNLFKRQE